jgi:crossover junction endodeoxyribonuclease RuvC
MIVLGIDPGSLHTGYAVIETENGKERVIEYGALHFRAHDDHFLRLKQIYERVTAVIDRTLPDVCAVEMPIYGKSAQSMLKLGRAQAAATLAALNREIPITQYTPKEIKKAVTGNGNAAKEQLWYMLKQTLHITEDKGLDASDALGVALCHIWRGAHQNQGNFKNWSDFLAANPDKIVGK